MDEFGNYSIEPSRAQRLLKKRSVRLGLIWGVWTVVALFFSTQVYMMYYAGKQPIPYAKAFFVQLSACYIWALVTPFVLWLARTFRIERTNWPRRLVFHSIVSITLISLLISTHFIVYMVIVNHIDHITPMNTFAYLYPNLDRWLLVYWTILLVSHALNYYHSYQQEELKAAELRTQLVQSQLEALKMQVQPHFLFNTLHSISALLSRDTEGARKMISRLGDFLRLTLENGGTSEVALRQEIDFLNGYLEIERIRFQDRLRTVIEVDPEVLDVRVPNLILQPIVENALRHAITNSDGGCVEISAAARNGSVRIQVKDNGPGLADERIALTKTGKGVGLANTQARLAYLYGSSHLFELTNATSGGLIVTLEIPRH